MTEEDVILLCSQLTLKSGILGPSSTSHVAGTCSSDYLLIYCSPSASCSDFRHKLPQLAKYFNFLKNFKEVLIGAMELSQKLTVCYTLKEHRSSVPNTRIGWLITTGSSRLHRHLHSHAHTHIQTNCLSQGFYCCNETP